MNHTQKRMVGSLVAAAAVLTLATGCSPTKQERLDSAQMEIDCDRLGGEFIEYREVKGVYDPSCSFEDITSLRIEEGR